MRVTYYIDEAGDPTIWSRRGKLLIGTEGCTNYFMMGLVHIEDIEAMRIDLEELRSELMNSTYFKDVPSLHHSQRKTSLYFHAKDDIQEVRYEVFKTLSRHNFEFHAFIRDKRIVAKMIEDFRAEQPSYRYNPNALYDQMVRYLTNDKLHVPRDCEVVFARRGDTDRTKALLDALIHTRDVWCRKNRITRNNGNIDVKASSPYEFIGLQIVDYMLWALQRCYEKREDRYIQAMWEKVAHIWDWDDKRRSEDGESYTKDKILESDILPEI
ncbi:MAG: DUF3800 domain-containing protein [Armatimonadota bacterium]